MPPRAVLFDFDGVLADTENLHVAAWERTFGAMGLDVPPEVCARSVEIDDRAFLAEVFASRSIRDGDVEGWMRRKQSLVRQMIADSPRLYPGVPELVERLRGRAKLGVVTTTWRENVEEALRPAGLLAAFETIVGKEDIRAPKPDPESYRLALRRLGVAAGEAVALEDSPTGLIAAREAGVRGVAIGHRRGSGEWSAHAAYLADLADDPAVLVALGL